MRLKPQEVKNIQRSVVEGIRQNITHDFEYGAITRKDLSNPTKLWEKIKESIFRTRIADYKTSVLDQARKFSDSRPVNFARVFYAIYFEHLTNRIIHMTVRRKGLSDAVIKNILRYSNVEDKLTWVLELIGLPPLNSKHRNTLRTLFEKRNAFVHYKWNLALTDAFVSDKSWAEERAQIESCILYLKKYEARVIYNREKRKIKKKISNLGFQIKVGRPK